MQSRTPSRTRLRRGFGLTPPSSTHSTPAALSEAVDAVVEARGLDAAAAVVQQDLLGVGGRLGADPRLRPRPNTILVGFLNSKSCMISFSGKRTARRSSRLRNPRPLASPGSSPRSAPRVGIAAPLCQHTRSDDCGRRASWEGEMAEGASAYRHVVLFKFKPAVAKAAVEAIENAFRALCAELPFVRGFEWGRNSSPEGLDEGFTHCFIVTFDGPEGRDAYLPHPAHQAFCQRYLDPALERRASSTSSRCAKARRIRWNHPRARSVRRVSARAPSTSWKPLSSEAEAPSRSAARLRRRAKRRVLDSASASEVLVSMRSTARRVDGSARYARDRPSLADEAPSEREMRARRRIPPERRRRAKTCSRKLAPSSLAQGEGRSRLPSYLFAQTRRQHEARRK